jgi:hypothetical protein
VKICWENISNGISSYVGGAMTSDDDEEESIDCYMVTAEISRIMLTYVIQLRVPSSP